jgi:hypothetical protein
MLNMGTRAASRYGFSSAKWIRLLAALAIISLAAFGDWLFGEGSHSEIGRSENGRCTEFFGSLYPLIYLLTKIVQCAKRFQY